MVVAEFHESFFPEEGLEVGNFTIDFTGLCVVHVKGMKATAYSLKSGTHCARLVFPLDALVNAKLPPGCPPADLVDIPGDSGKPGQGLLLSLNIGGYRLRFDNLPTDVIAKPGTPQPPPVKEVDDLGYALDLAYMSGEASLSTWKLEQNANAVLDLPAGTLGTRLPDDKEMINTKWKVFGPGSGVSRVQALSDGIRLKFTVANATTVTLILDDNIAGGGATTAIELNNRDYRLAMSSLCRFSARVVGMPDVREYNIVTANMKLSAPEKQLVVTPNNTHCPPVRFIE